MTAREPESSGKILPRKASSEMMNVKQLLKNIQVSDLLLKLWKRSSLSSDKEQIEILIILCQITSDYINTHPVFVSPVSSCPVCVSTPQAAFSLAAARASFRPAVSVSLIKNTFLDLYLQQLRQILCSRTDRSWSCALKGFFFYKEIYQHTLSFLDFLCRKK